jgi:hypothetical protein
MASNILLDVTQDSEKNVFSIRMQPVYRACVDDSGAGITKRSLDRIETFLAEEGKSSAFATVARRVTHKFLTIDRKHMKLRLQDRVDHLLRQLYVSVDDLLDNKVVDQAEAAARLELQDILPVLLFEWKEASQQLRAVVAKYEKSQ